MENATGYRFSSLKSKKGFTVTGSTLAQTNLRNSSYCDNVSAELNNVTMDYSKVDISGSLTAKKVKTSCTERVANSEYQFEKCTLSAEKAIKINDCNLQFTEIINGSNTKDMIEMADTTLTDSTVRAYGDLNMDFCKLYGTKVTVDGNLYCIRCIVGAEYEGQNSPITVYGEKVDIINSDFKGIAETKQGARTVYLGNGIPATQTYDYYTFSGASLCVYTDSDIGIENHTVNLTDSRLLMDRIFLEDANTVLNINETRLQLCTSTVNKDNVTITGNIQIVTGNWNASRESGIFIDFLGDYYTFDEATGELHLNNDYGVRGWFQIAQTYQGGFVPVTELTDKVKKVVVGDDVTDAEWLEGFKGYKNLKEIEFGDTVEQIGGGYPNFIFLDCTSLETVTIGSNVRYMPSSSSGGGIFASCENLKKVVIKSEYLIEDPDSLKYWFPMKGMDTRYKHRDELKIYVPAGQEDRYKEAMPEYKDQIIGMDFPKEPEYLIGDTNGDGRITIIDVTEIQRHLAEIIHFSDEQLMLADTNGDGKVDIGDATHLQKYLAEFDGIVLGKQPT